MSKDQASPFFLTQSFDGISMGVKRAVPSAVRDIHDVLRTFIWRDTTGTNSKSQLLNKSYKGGLLMARVSYNKLGDILGISRRSARRYIHHLVDIGWIYTRDIDDGYPLKSARHFVLGNVSFGCKGSASEVLFSELCISRAMEGAISFCEKEGRLFRDLSMDDRQGFLEGCFEEISVKNLAPEHL